MNLTLSSPFGCAHLEIQSIDVASFLGRTFTIVAPGEESSFVDIDAELDELLWRG